MRRTDSFIQTFRLVLWSQVCPSLTGLVMVTDRTLLQAGEGPHERKVHVRDGGTWRLGDHEWILAKQDYPWDLFQVWSLKVNGWKLVAFVDAEQILENAELCLVRLESAKECVGLGAYITRMQAAKMHADMGEELAQDLMEGARAEFKARVHVADTIWVLVWSKVRHRLWLSHVRTDEPRRTRYPPPLGSRSTQRAKSISRRTTASSTSIRPP